MRILYKPRLSQLLFLALYAVLPVLTAVEGFNFSNGRFDIVDFDACFNVLCMLAFAWLLLPMERGRRFLLLSVLVGIVPIFAWQCIKHCFFGWTNDGAKALGVFLSSSALFVLCSAVVGVLQSIRKAFQHELGRPSRRGLGTFALSLLFLGLVGAAALGISCLCGWGMAQFFWRTVDYGFWNNEGLVQYAPGYTFGFVAQSFSCLFMLPAAVLCIACIRKEIFALLPRYVPCALLLLLAVCTFLTLVSIGGAGDCAWNPLEDTRHTASFKPEGIPSLSLGQTQEDVRAILGEPLSIGTDKAGGITLYYTGDAASFLADFAWYELNLHFGADGQLNKITSRWMND